MNERLLYPQPPSSLSLPLSLCPLPGMHPPFLLANPYPLLGLSSDAASFLPKSFQNFREDVPLCAFSFLGSDVPFSLSISSPLEARTCWLHCPIQSPLHSGRHTGGWKEGRENDTRPKSLWPHFSGAVSDAAQEQGTWGERKLGGRNPPALQLHPRTPPCCPWKVRQRTDVWCRHTGHSRCRKDA